MELTEKDWTELMKGYPEAYAFMLSRSLSNEYRRLKGRLKLNNWESRRLADLEKVREITGYKKGGMQ